MHRAPRADDLEPTDLEKRAHLLGTVLADQTLDMQLLLGCETAFLADCTPCGFGCQGFEAVFFRHLDGAAHSALCHIQRTGDVFDGHAASMQSHRLFASLVLSLPRQLASVFFIHPSRVGAASKKSTLHCQLSKGSCRCKDKSASSRENPH